MNDLITKIQSELPGFSKGQKQIARFILEHYDKAAFMTASRLGAVSYTHLQQGAENQCTDKYRRENKEIPQRKRE